MRPEGLDRLSSDGMLYAWLYPHGAPFTTPGDWLGAAGVPEF
jgi:hypothetical protein